MRTLGDLVTGDDILKIGTVDSADYPVKARPDDIIRKRKPKPPPWWTRPGLIEREEEPVILDHGSESRYKLVTKHAHTRTRAQSQVFYNCTMYRR